MQASNECEPQAVDSQGQIFFRQAEQNERSHMTGTELEDDRLSEASYHTVDRTDVAVNTSHLQENEERSAIEQVSRMMRDVRGVLRDVVTEFKNLNQRQGLQADRETNDMGYAGEVPWRMRHAGLRNQGNGDFRATPFDQNVNNGCPEPMPENQTFQSRMHNRHAYNDCTLNERFEPRHEHGRSWQARGHVPRYTDVKIPPFTGKEDWTVWSSKFEAMAHRYGWTEEDKLDNLLPKIEGQASEFVFSQLPVEILDNYSELMSELTRRYRVIETSRSFAAKFSRRNQKHGETVEEYAAELKRLYGKAHGHRDRHIRDEDLVRRFLDGLLDQDTKFEVEYHKEPMDIDEAVYHVVNLIQTKNGCRYDRQGRYSSRQADVYKQENSSWKPDYARDNTNRNERRIRYGERHVNRIQDDSLYELEVEPDHNTEIINRVPSDKVLDLNTSCSDFGTPVEKKHTQEELLQCLIERVGRLEQSFARAKDRQTRSDVECYSCHERGHYARDCPSRDSKNFMSDSPVATQESTTDDPLNYKGPALAPRERSM
ncbi:uncharacterized protein LOC123539473 [Mercenaria mercenaria]|uniref:uncharacterized protein LOC123539473 n=1 Tax=Mercenaria mercenaria TaxID=6596 RepID=UPI00234EA0F4|nr:uncharacterized protein LOC123539473 [Mercenaria mercenaria]